MNSNNCNMNLIETKSFYEEQWVGMPEFIQEKKEPYTKIIIRVDNESNLDELSKLLGQKLTPKTKSIWFPFKSHFRETKQPKWISES